MADTPVEYSFLSKENFYQIVEEHLNSISKPDRSVITKEIADQIINLIENNFKDKSASDNLRRWARQFIIKNINGRAENVKSRSFCLHKGRDVHRILS